MKDSALASAYFVGSLLPALLVAAMGWCAMWHGVLKHNPIIREVRKGTTPPPRRRRRRRRRRLLGRWMRSVRP